jgi:hypothetical protein
VSMSRSHRIQLLFSQGPAGGIDEAQEVSEMRAALCMVDEVS